MTLSCGIGGKSTSSGFNGTIAEGVGSGAVTRSGFKPGVQLLQALGCDVEQHGAASLSIQPQKACRMWQLGAGLQLCGVRSARRAPGCAFAWARA